MEYTNVTMNEPGDLSMQRSPWSSYYNTNCAKGEVYRQLCGWMGVDSLQVESLSDTDYMLKSNIIKRQVIYASDDIENNQQKIPFINMLDKGYRCTEGVFRNGEQLVLQPIFARSDERFSLYDTITSASVATDRSGNEQAVRLSRQSGYIKRGIKGHTCPIRTDNVWLAWSFLYNFMFEPVH